MAQTVDKIIDQKSLATAVQELCLSNPDIKIVVDGLPAVPLRNRMPGFKGLAEIIVAQQVSKASAAAIFDRLQKKVVPFEAEAFLIAGEPVWIEAGLSRAKQSTLMHLAMAVSGGELDLGLLAQMEAKEAMAILTAFKGIGPWTAEVFLMFCAGHSDIFPAGDVALQHAIADVMKLNEKPSTRETYKISEQWSPYRSVAARILYAHYAQFRGRTEIPV